MDEQDAEGQLWVAASLLWALMWARSVVTFLLSVPLALCCCGETKWIWLENALEVGKGLYRLDVVFGQVHHTNWSSFGGSGGVPATLVLF